jgi:hypothetical protein
MAAGGKMRFTGWSSVITVLLDPGILQSSQLPAKPFSYGSYIVLIMESIQTASLRPFFLATHDSLVI